jgi:hypothetical protein
MRTNATTARRSIHVDLVCFQSFAELLIQYVDQQSTGKGASPTAKFNTDEYLQRYDHNGIAAQSHQLRKASMSSSSTANPFLNSNYSSLSRTTTTTNTTPLVVPTATNEHDGVVLHGSSTILKDLLKT